MRRSDLCANFACDLEYYPHVIELFSRERGRFFRLGSLAPELGRPFEFVEVSWAIVDGDDNQRILTFIDLSDYWTSFCIIMHEAYCDTYAPLFAKSTLVN
jgi:hypothetical protein